MAFAVVSSSHTEFKIILSAGYGSGPGYDCIRMWGGDPQPIDGTLGWLTVRKYAKNLHVYANYNYWPITGSERNSCIAQSYWINNIRIGSGTIYNVNGYSYHSIQGSWSNKPTLYIANVYTSSLRCGSGGAVWYKLRYWQNNVQMQIASVDYTNALPYHEGGEYCEYIAIPDEHYRVKQWLLNSSTITPLNNKKTEVGIYLPSTAAQVFCEFEQYEWHLTIKSNVSSDIGALTGGFNGYKEKDSLLSMEATCLDKENYRFIGWYYGYGKDLNEDECNQLLPSGESSTYKYTMPSRDVTIIAKFESRQTNLSVSINESSGGTADVFVNDVLVASDVVAWNNADARDGWMVRLIATAKIGFFFKYWVAPYGREATQNITMRDFAMMLLSRKNRDNHFIAYFSPKNEVPVNCTLVSGDSSNVRGYVSYSGDYGKGGTFTEENADDSTAYVTEDFYTETDYIFSAKEYADTRLYKFVEWQVKLGSEWVSPTNTDKKVSWVSSVDLEKGQLIVNIPDSLYEENVSAGTLLTAFNVRAVFVERATYTIKELAVVGEHEIFPARKAVDEGCSINEYPTPDKYVEKTIDGKVVTLPYWIEGTTFELRLTPAAKWRAKGFSISKASEDNSISTIDSASVSIVMDADYDYIFGLFEAMKYIVNINVEKNSEMVGDANFEYASGLDENDEIVYTPTKDSAEVWVDTEIRLHSSVKSPYVAYNETTKTGNVKFSSWSRNNVSTDFEEHHTEICNGKSTYTAHFAVRFQVVSSGVYTETTDSGTTDYPLGDVSIDSLLEGIRQEITIPRDLPSFDSFLPCSSTCSLKALARKFETSAGVSVQGYFNGWYERNTSTQLESLIREWGLEVDDVVVTIPRFLVAYFTNENRWPILSLRHTSGATFCTFDVSGQRTERSQQIGTEHVVLTNPNDFFVDSYGTVQIGINKFDASFRFQYWMSKEFARDKDGNKLFDEETGEELFVNEQIYAYTESISVYMTSDIVLTPVFFTGSPIMTEARLANGMEQTFGDVSIESDVMPIEVETNAKKAFAEGDVVTFVASPRNLYRFVGWYQDANCSVEVSKMPRFEVTVNEAKTFYAKFEQDANAIYTFGTSKTNKTMRWKSKRLSLVAPASFSVAQIDAEGYKDSNGNDTVSLSVHHASSPDIPAEMETYTIKDSNSRRLAFGKRNEKLYEFELMSSTPINWAVFSTSVTGITGGAQQ